jgi:hypothetical protein
VQQQLQPNTAQALRRAVPDLEDEDIQAMMRAPMRSFDPNNLQVRWLAALTGSCSDARRRRLLGLLSHVFFQPLAMPLTIT